MWLPVVESECPEDALAVPERERHHRPRPFGGVRSAVLRRQPVSGRDVFRDEGRVERNRRRRAADRLDRARDVLGRQPGVGGDAPRLGRIVELPERVSIGRECSLGELEDRREHLLRLERAEDRGRRVQEEPEPLEVLGRGPLGIDGRSTLEVVGGHATPVFEEPLSVLRVGVDSLSGAEAKNPVQNRHSPALALARA